MAATRYEPVIGLEVHAQRLTQTKLFCGCSVEVGLSPNQNVCPVCLGLPGSLPVGNRRAIELAVRAALALSCTIAPSSIFARKNYFYPDLPKGYQISQFALPFSSEGWLDIELEGGVKRARIVRVHLEEDAGKNVHGVAGESIVDLNRAGTPLVEIVGAPDLYSSSEAVAYLRALREILMFVGANDGNLEEGSFRCDANVSLRPVGTTQLGTRTELKNLNSFRFVQRAIESEILRQTEILESGNQVEQETRSYDPDTDTTRPLRSKADAHDYRYFPEPDLPPLVLDGTLVDEQRRAVGELPAQVRKRWTEELGLSAASAATLTQHPEYVRFFEAVRARLESRGGPGAPLESRGGPGAPLESREGPGAPLESREGPGAPLESREGPGTSVGGTAVKAANWIQTEVLRDTACKGLTATFPVSPEQVAELLGLVESGAIFGPQAKKVHAALVGTQRSAREVVAELGLEALSGDAELRPLCERIVADNPKNVAAYRAGKVALLGFFVGQVMKQSGGRANPERVNQILRELLGGVTS